MQNVSPRLHVSHIFYKCEVILIPQRSTSQHSTSCPPGSSFGAELLSSSSHLPLLAESFKLRGSGTWRAHLCLLWGSSEGVAEALFLCRVVPLMHLRAQDSKQPRSFYSRPRPSTVSFSSRSGCERQDAISDTLTFDPLALHYGSSAGPERGPSSDRLISDIPT